MKKTKVQIERPNANDESERTELSDAVAQFVMTSSEIQRNFDTNDVELIWQQVVVDDDNGPLPENITPATIRNDTI